MQSFQQDFGVQRVIKLEQNYRSHGNILDAANALISNNRRRLGKNLWTAESKGERLRVYEAATDIEEAGFVVEEVKSLNREGVRLSEIALLYRSNAQSRVLEHALFNAGVAYRVYGGLRFFERQEIKHALAYLRLLASDEDDGALLRVINFPTRGIGTRSMEQLQDAARAKGLSLWAAAKGRAEGAGITGEEKAASGAVPSPLIPHPSSLRGVPAFVALIESMRATCRDLPLPEIIEHVIEHSGLKQYYQNERDGTDRLENLGELVNAAAAFVADEHGAAAQAAADQISAADIAQTHNPALAAFLAHAALEAGDNQAQAGADALQLMSVHSSKGLEFHTVFISGLEEGLFPHENSLSEADGREEERRLMYVALTRARRRLYLSYAQSRMLHGQTRYNIASSFFREIPEQLMRRLNQAASLRVSSFDTTPRSRAPNVVTQSSWSMPEPDSPWRIGQNVVHPKFGAGVIVNAEGRGADARVQVNFRREGTKWLALAYAKLTAA